MRNSLRVPQLTEEIETISRKPEVESLLQALREEDELFDYNVHASIRATYDDDALLEHLKDIYSNRFFVVEETGTIDKHIEKGDRVLKKGDKQEVSKELKNHDYVYFRRMEDSDRVMVARQKKTWTLSIDDLVVVKRDTTFWVSGALYSKIKLRDFKEKLTGNHRLEYIGKDLIEYSEFIPDRSDGLVMYISSAYSAKKVKILWAKRKDLIQRIGQYNSQPYTETKFDLSEIRLIRENPINFEQLYQKHIRGEVLDES